MKSLMERMKKTTIKNKPGVTRIYLLKSLLFIRKGSDRQDGVISILTYCNLSSHNGCIYEREVFLCFHKLPSDLHMHAVANTHTKNKSFLKVSEAGMKGSWPGAGPQ